MAECTRLCGSKVRTGCLTCKKRHVKCDEAKPFCNRCTSAGRQCGGYAPPEPDRRRKNLHVVIYVPSAQERFAEIGPQFPGNPVEQQCFDFFHVRTAQCFPIEFSYAVMRVAYELPAVKHAAVALGAFHRFYEFGGIHPEFPCQQYGKAINNIINSDPTPNIHTIVVCALLLAYIECLRGNRNSAIIHIRSGKRLLQQSCSSKIVSEIVPHSILQSLLLRLDSQVVEILGTTLDREGVNSSIVEEPPQPSALHTAKEAYTNFESFINYFLHIQLGCAFLRDIAPSESGVANIHAKRWRYLTCLQASVTLFHSLEHFNSILLVHANEYCKMESQDAPRYKIIHIWLITTKLFLSIDHKGSQTIWDQFTDDFNNIVTIAESLVDHSTTSNDQGNKVRAEVCAGKMPSGRRFSFILGIVAPLFLTTIQCRHSCIRRRAYQLLLSMQGRREGLWDASEAAKIARRAMEMEEAIRRPLHSLAVDPTWATPAQDWAKTVTVVLGDRDVEIMAVIE